MVVFHFYFKVEFYFFKLVYMHGKNCHDFFISEFLEENMYNVHKTLFRITRGDFRSFFFKNAIFRYLMHYIPILGDFHKLR